MANNSMGDFVSQLRPALHRLQDWPYPDQIDHALFAAFMKNPHDVGGDPDAPAIFEEKEEEAWELNTFVTCEVLGWRGIWTSEERRRLGNVDVGRTIYHGFPYYGRWVWAIARCLVEKDHITLRELLERVDEVSARVAAGAENALSAAPRSVGDPTTVSRNRHHIEALGKGDPQRFDGQAGAPRFAVGDRVRVRDLPTIFYTRTQEYLRGKPATIVEVSYESLVPEDEAFDREEQQPQWFYIVRFNMTDVWDPYAGAQGDTLQAEISELWLQPLG